MKVLIEKLFEQQTLSQEEAEQLLCAITDGSVNDEQIVAIVSALRMRSITSDELKGFRNAILSQAIIPKLDTVEAIDVCGTGGDCKDTFNISTLAAIVIAGAGYKVIKHGNYGVSSPVGSSTILEQMGYKFSTNEDILNAQLSQSNMCFLHAPLFHPALKKVAPIRAALGVRTFFNFLGPLVNPVQPLYQLAGVYNLQLLRIYKEILCEERKGFKVVHSLDGYDEVSLTSPFKIVSSVDELIMFPEDLNFSKLDPSDLLGGETLEDNRQMFNQILNGEGTAAQNAVVLANAALGIQCFDTKMSFKEAFALAKHSLMAGAAKTGFGRAIELSQKNIKSKL